MENYISYINKELPDKPGDKLLYRYKRKVLEEMTARANEISSRGLRDRKVIDDLVVSEYPDLSESYAEFYKKETAAMNRKRNIILNVIGSAIYLLAVVVIFLGVSFATKMWNMTWAIVVDGVLLWVVYLLSLGVQSFSAMKKIFHIFARACLMGAVIVFGVAAFILVVALTDIQGSWLILMFSLIAMFLCDAVFCTTHKHRLAIFYWLLYIPVISVFVFIIIGAAGLIAWRYAWIFIPLSLVIDLIIILFAIGKNKLSGLEVADTWNEN